jgi:hypothetical protein
MAKLYTERLGHWRAGDFPGEPVEMADLKSIAPFVGIVIMIGNVNLFCEIIKVIIFLWNGYVSWMHWNGIFFRKESKRINIFFHWVDLYCIKLEAFRNNFSIIWNLWIF